MECIHAFWLALLQGLTEFLPISSSAHLILVPVLFGWQDQGLAFDIAVHVGTLLAVVTYFRKDLLMIVRDWFLSLTGKGLSHNAILGWGVILGTVPVGIVGLLAKDWIETVLRSPLVIAVATIVFGVLLWIAEKWGKRNRTIERLTMWDALIIGMFQAVALIPGTSRSGITITGGLFLGMDGKSAARFSFLLSIPVIFLAGMLEILNLIQAGEPVDWYALLLGMAVSGLSAYGCITWFMRLLDWAGMWPFVVYRLFLGGFLLYVFWPQ